MNSFQQYFEQTGPMMVTGQIGSDLASGFKFIVNDVQRLQDNKAVLASTTGEIMLYEDEIYRVGPLNPDRSLSLLMDGGTELRFTSVRQAEPGMS